MSNATAAQPQKRRVRKRILIPSALLIVLALIVGWLYWRGTAAESLERNPKTVADGTVVQLLNQDGRIAVRCAMVVPAPPAAVWQVVTDYDQHPKFVRYIAELSSQKLDDGRRRLTGLAHSRLWGDFPFEIDVKHDEAPAEGAYAASWHEEGKSGFAVNRGGWTLKKIGENQTLLAFSKQAEIPGYPNFLLRNILLDRVGLIVRSMSDEVARREGK